MGIMARPLVTVLEDGGKCFEHLYEHFELKAYVPATKIDGTVNNYTFRAPLLMVFEEKKQSMEEAIEFAKESGLSDVAAAVDSSVFFIYPTCEGGWSNATQEVYASFIAEVKMDPRYEDGLVEFTTFFTNEFEGYFLRGAKFRADIYSFGASADYVAKHLLKTVEGEFLWGPGEITPAMCSMERLSVTPVLERKDIGIISVNNSEEINASLKECENLLIKDQADYKEDFNCFVRQFKMWCNHMEMEPDFEKMNMTEEAGCIIVPTSPDHCEKFKDAKEHKVGYFAYYNNDLFEKGPVPLLLGFHGGGDSAMFLTFVAEWYKVAHKYGFLYVPLENHQFVTATEVISFLKELKKRYPIDTNRIYATGFSMGSCKTWEMFQEYPEVFAGFAPASALFPVEDNPLAQSHGPNFNTTISVPMFYSGGEASPLPELPCQEPSALGRIQYLAKVNHLKKSFEGLKYEERENWENSIWGVSGEREEKLYDDTRDSYLTIQYFESEDGVCRTALGSVSGQGHEFRHHSCENAWKFISQFTLENK